jgi:hypothetical protein
VATLPDNPGDVPPYLIIVQARARIRFVVPVGIAWCAVVWGTLACRGALPATAPAVAARACELLADDAPRRDTITVVVTTDVRRDRLVRGMNAGERFVFGGSYETLIGVACDGTIVPRLATSWRPEPTGGWTLVLRADARFWNGDRVRAADVLMSWRRTAMAEGDSATSQFADSAEVVDDSTLRVHLFAGSLAQLGHARFRVYREHTGAAWPDGTGPWQLSQGAGSGLRLSNPAARVEVRIRAGDAIEARDIIDEGADVVLTDDPALAAYAASRASASSVPLAWDQVWVAILPWHAISTAATLDDDALGPFRSALARDVALGEARAATTRQGGVSSVCPIRGPGAVRADPTRIAYLAGDAVARTLAERLVALAGIAAAERRENAPVSLVAPELVRAGDRLVTLALDWRAFNDTVATASSVASIVALAPLDVASCAGARIVPLVETRWRVVVRGPP